jgi:hypothetical protein
LEKTNILENIVKDCYWDYDIDIRDLESILIDNNQREQQKLFAKIIYNSKDKLLSLSVFSTEQLQELFANFKVTYNEKYIKRHILVLKSLLLGEKSYIKGLEWK